MPSDGTISPRECRTLASCFSQTSLAISGKHQRSRRIPADSCFRRYRASTVDRRDVGHHIHVIDGVDAIAARAELREIRAFGNIVRQHDGLLWIVPQNLGGRSAFEVAAKTGVGALAELDQFPAARRRRSQNRRGHRC